MTKKDTFNLLFPNIFYIMLAAAAFWEAGMIRQATRDYDSQQKFDAFVTNVQSGKWQLTTDRWIYGMRQERATAEAYRKAYSDTTEMMQVIGWSALGGFFLQIIGVFSIRKKLWKP